MLLERLFTTGSLRPQDSMHFVTAGSAATPLEPTLSVPDDWSLEAAQTFAESLCLDRPAATQVIEENTLPSWLWQRRLLGTESCAESSVLEVFERIAGAATYRGWKLGLWSSEVEASTFYDEVQALLLTRRLVLAPQDMARLGLDWAYGLKTPVREQASRPVHHTDALIMQNETIDSILRHTQPQARSKWTTYLTDSKCKPSTHIAFADTIVEWGTMAADHNVPRAMLNLLAFRTTDGTIDQAALQHAAKLAVLLLELHYDALSNNTGKERPLAIGIGNLTALLQSLAMAYDSPEARGTAAALCAIISATATQTSALLASKLGLCEDFTRQREIILRSLRNKLRATFGEKNDYEHLSVLPQTLELESGTDLVLISAARYASEEALRLVQEHGLRHMQVTSLYEDSAMGVLMDAAAQGIDAEPALTCDYALDGDVFERRLRPAIVYALDKLGYDTADIKAIKDHIVGYCTLVGAPAINQATLREKGFDEATLARIEAVLPFVDHLRLAFTPWVVGTAFCRLHFGMDDKELQNPHFDMLRHLGFSSQDIMIANAFCCGHRTAKGVLELDHARLALFETAETLTSEASLAMAAAVQPFVTGDAHLHLRVPASLSAELRGAYIIKAWELGLKGLTLELDAPYKAANVMAMEQHLMKRRSPRLKPQQDAAVAAPQSRALKPKAPVNAVTLKRSTGNRKNAPARSKQR